MAIQNKMIEKVKVDAGVDFCDCCHVYGCEEMTRIELVPTPGRSDRRIYLCDECYPAPTTTVVNELEVARVEAKRESIRTNEDWTVEESMINVIGAIRRKEISPHAALVLTLDRGTEEEPCYCVNYFMTSLRSSEGVALCEVGKVLMLRDMNYV